MDTNAVAQTNTALSTGADRYAPIYYGGTGAFSSNPVTSSQNVMTQPGSVKNLYVNQDTAPGAAQTRTYWVAINGTNTGVTCQLGGAGTGLGLTFNNDTTNVASFNAGDAITVHTNSTTATSTGGLRWSVAVTQAANTSFLASVTGSTMGTSGSGFIPLQGVNYDTVAANVEAPCAAPGVIGKTAQVVLNGTPGGAANIKFTLVVNGVDTATVMTVTSAATTASYSGAGIAVVRGDRWYWRADFTGTPSARHAMPTAEFDPTTNGNSLLCFGGGSAEVATAQRFMTIVQGNSIAYSATEQARRAVTQACVFNNLYIYDQSAITGVTSYTYQPYFNASVGSISAVVTGGATVGEDNTNTQTTSGGDTISMSVTPAGTPATPLAEWSIVAFIQPPAVATTGGTLPLLGVG